jgi:hypothetical protein
MQLFVFITLFNMTTCFGKLNSHHQVFVIQARNVARLQR